MLRQGSSPQAAAEGGSDLASASIRPSMLASVRPSALLPRAVACEDWVFSSLPPNDVIPRDDRGEATYPSIYPCKLWLVERVLEQELSEGDLC